MTRSSQSSQQSSRRMPAAYRNAVRNAPKGVQGGSFVADVDAEQTVVFLVGMRVNRWRRVRSWWPVLAAMPRMLAELEARPDVGLLEARSYWSGRVFLVVQHWSSIEALGRFAQDPQMSHQPAWAAFNRAAAGDGDVGVFHETYEVPRAGIESLYGNMPPFGLALAHGGVARSGGRRTRAQDRMGQHDPEYVDAS